MKVVAWISRSLAWLDGLFDGHQIVSAPELPPVVLVHGIYSSSGDLARLASHLRREGRTVLSLDFATCDGACLLEDLAAELHAFVEEHVPTGAFDLVGFSMGGLVSRYYLQRLAGEARVTHFVSLAAPCGDSPRPAASGPGSCKCAAAARSCAISESAIRTASAR